jgi:hypothetical protein
MNAYGWIIALHAAIAVLGTGQLAAIAVVAKAGREGTAAARTIPIIGKLASTATWSLVLLLLTGALAMYVGTAFFLQMWWLRISMVLFLVLGALSGQVRRAVRHGDEASLPRIERLAWAMCVLLFAIVVLMETKPW